MTDIPEDNRLAAHRPALQRLAALRAAWPVLRAEFAADGAIWIAAAIYVVAANLLALALPSHPSIGYLLYAPVWLHAGSAALLIFLLARTVPGVIRERPDHPLGRLVVRAAAFASPRSAAGLALIVLQVVLMGTFTSVKNMLPQMSGYVWDARLADLDAALFGGHDPWRIFAPIVSNAQSLAAVEFLYVTGWMFALGLVPAAVALMPSMKPIRVRFFLTYILCWALLGNLLALADMSAGPAYYGDVTGDGERFRPLIDMLAVNTGSTWSAYDIQRALWDVYERGMVSFGTGISAFPSLHVAMATLWTIVGFQRSRRLGLAGLAFAAFIMTASVALGWHYAVDGFASIPLVLLIWVTVGWALRRFAPRTMETAREW